MTVANKGERVSSSAVALLNKMGLKPFFFGINVDYIYEDGLVYEAAILDLGETGELAFCGCRPPSLLFFFFHLLIVSYFFRRC